MPSVKKPSRGRHPTYIKAWREFRHLTQERAADRVGISRENYGRIESGKVPYNQDTLEVCAEALGCTAADLLERNPIEEQAIDKLRRLLAKATPEQEKTILRVAESLIENKG